MCVVVRETKSPGLGMMHVYAAREEEYSWCCVMKCSLRSKQLGLRFTRIAVQYTDICERVLVTERFSVTGLCARTIHR